MTTRATPGRRETETQAQIALFDLLSRLEGQLPLLQYVTHVVNESNGGQKVRTIYRKRDGSTGHKMVPVDVLRGAQLGKKPGVPDVVGFLSNRCPIAGFPAYYFPGFTIERKAGNGVILPDQERWNAHLTAEGWYAIISTDWTAEARLIIAWVGGDPGMVEGL